MYKILVHFAVKTPSLVREGPDQGSLSRIHDCKNICDKNDWVCIKNQSFCIKVCNKILVFVKNIVNFHNSFVNLQFIIWFFNKNTKYDLPCHSTAGSIFQSLWNRHAPKSAGSLLGAAYSSCTQGASACNTCTVWFLLASGDRKRRARTEQACVLLWPPLFSSFTRATTLPSSTVFWIL